MSQLFSSTRTRDFHGIQASDAIIFGRPEELGFLHEALEHENVRIVILVASGGVGKSSLAARWLHETIEAMRGVGTDCTLGRAEDQPAFAWSFYSQGTRRDTISIDDFLKYAMRWAGLDADLTGTQADRGRLLADAIVREPSVVLLDGMEPLQEGEGVGRGGLKTRDMYTLLRGIADAEWSGGLCVVTTRVPLTELGADVKGEVGSDRPVWEINLDDLPLAAATQLLEAKGVKSRVIDGSDLESIAILAGRHALTLKILGTYLSEYKGSDPRAAEEVLSSGEALEVSMGDSQRIAPAARILRAFEEQMVREGRMIELTILFLLGLFDRPADSAALGDVLGAGNVVQALHDGNWSGAAGEGGRSAVSELEASPVRVGDDRWLEATERLRELGLVNQPLEHAREDQRDDIDAHPLIREHFQRQLQMRRPEAWKLGNERLYRWFRSLVTRPPGDFGYEDFTTLYVAAAYGCRAGLHQEVHDELLCELVWQKNENGRQEYRSTQDWGLRDTDLATLALFFRTPWSEFVGGLRPETMVHIMTNVGVRLRQLGKLEEAIECFGKAEELADAGDSIREREDAIYAPAQRSELLVIGGYYDAALDAAQIAVEKAEAASDLRSYLKMHAYSSYADVYFQLGRIDEAEERFEQALRVNDQESPDRPFFYSQSLYRYGYLMIETGRAEELVELYDDPDFGRAGANTTSLATAIRELVLGAAQVAQAREACGSEARFNDLEKALAQLNQSIAAFESSAYNDYLVRGLIERARCRRLLGRLDDALVDLNRVEVVTSALSPSGRREMDQQRTDALLERAALTIAKQTIDQCGLVQEAAEEVERLGYGRRNADVEALHRSARRFGVFAKSPLCIVGRVGETPGVGAELEPLVHKIRREMRVEEEGTRNDELVGLVRWSQEGEEVGLACKRTDFAQFVATRDARLLVGHVGRDLSNAIGVCIVLATSDERLLLERRPAGVLHGRLRHVVGGMVEVSDVGPSGKADFAGAALRELKEELGVSLDREALVLLGLAYDFVHPHPEVMFVAKTELDLAGVLGARAASRGGAEELEQAEFEEMEPLPARPDLLRTEIDGRQHDFVPTGMAALLAYGRWAGGGSWFEQQLQAAQSSFLRVNV